jgi:uncharacterized protein YggE
VAEPADRVEVSLGVRTQAASMLAAASSATELLGRVQSVLAEHDPDATFASSHYNVYPDHGPNGRVRGFIAEHNLTVGSPNVATFGDLLTVVTEAAGNATQIHNLEFRLQRTPERVSAARALAWEDARSRAEHLARLAGRSLGPAAKIHERHPMAGPAPMLRQSMEMAAAVPLAAPDDAEVRIDLDVEFTFAD